MTVAVTPADLRARHASFTGWISGSAARGDEPRPWDALFAALIFTRLLVNLGALGAAFFMAVTLLYAYLRPIRLKRVFQDAWPAWGFPAFATLSILWAKYPQVTVRGVMQMVVTVLAGLMLSQARASRQVIVGMLIAFGSYVSLSIPFGRLVADGMTSIVLTGFAGEARNYFSDYAMTTMLLSVTAAVMAFRARRRVLSLGCLGITAISLYAVERAHSAGGIIASGVALAMMIVLLLGRRLSPAAKISGLSVLFVAIIAGLLLKDVILELVIDTFNKSHGLTGRTDLWRYAAQQMTQRPWFGLGLLGFWNVNNPDAVEVWLAFKVGPGSGFTFHNTYIQTIVDLGYVGLAVMLLSWTACIAALVRQYVALGSITTCLWLSYMAAELAKSGVESIEPFPFAVPTITLCVALGWGFRRAEETVDAPATPPRSALSRFIRPPMPLVAANALKR